MNTRRLILFCEPGASARRLDEYTTFFFFREPGASARRLDEYTTFDYLLPAPKGLEI